jgi:hypothetical protein
LAHFSAGISYKRTDTVGEPQGFIFQWPNIFPGVDADRLNAQIQAIDPITWHFVADILDKLLNYHLLEFANSIRMFVTYSPSAQTSQKGSIFHVLPRKRALSAARWRVVPCHEGGLH